MGDDLVRRCFKCGAIKAAPCVEWDCPQHFVRYAAHVARIAELERTMLRRDDKWETALEAAEKRVAALEAETATLNAEYDASMADNAVQKAELRARAEAADKLLRERDAFIVKTEMWDTFLAWLARLDADKRRN